MVFPQESEDEYYDRMAQSLEGLREMLVLAEERYLQRSLHRLVPVNLVDAAPSVTDTTTEEPPDVEILDDIDIIAEGGTPAEARTPHAIPPIEHQ